MNAYMGAVIAAYNNNLSNQKNKKVEVKKGGDKK